MSRLLILALLLSPSLWAQLAVPVFPTNPQANPSLTDFGISYVANGASCPWLRTHFDISIPPVFCAGPPASVLGTYVNSLDYIDAAGNGGDLAPIATFYEYAWAFCDNISYATCENLWLHVDRDYYNSQANTLPYGDLFDVSENTSTGNISPTQAVHGAFTVHGSTFTDVTCRLYAFGASCPGGGATPVAIVAGDYLYIGYYQPFDQMNFVLTTPSSTGTVVWEYSTGVATWASLSTNAIGFTDGTSNLTANGKVSYTPPPDSGTPWKRAVVNGSKKKYWVRFHNATSGVTFTSVKGDNQYSSSVCSDCGGHAATNRGWSPTAYAASTACSGSPCLVDSQPYNPTPPSSCPSVGTSTSNCATARFPYQARFIDGSYANTFWPNPDIFIGSVTPANNLMAQQMAWKVAYPGAIPTGKTAVLFDNIGAINGTNGPLPNVCTGAAPLLTFMDLHCGGSCACSTVTTDEGSGGVYGFTPSLNEATNLVHAEMPTGFIVDMNATGNTGSTLAQTGDTANYEFAVRGVYEPQATPWQGFDDMMATTNTRGSVDYYQMIDSGRWQIVDGYGVYHINDDGDRAPMIGLATFYMADDWCGSLTNCFNGGPYNYNYSGMTWGTSVNASYTETSEVGTYTNVAGTLAVQINPVAVGTPFSMVLTGDSNVTTAGGNYFATLYEFRLCPTPTTCNAGDKFPATKTSTDNYASSNTPGSYVPILNTYPIGTTVQFSSTVVTYPPNPFPAYNQIWMDWSIWWPAMGVDIGKPDPNGYNHGVRSCGSTCQTTLLPVAPPSFILGSANTCIGHAGVNGCSSSAPATCSHSGPFGDVWRRDFTKAVVLVRNFGYQFCPEDYDWPGQNIPLASLQSFCSGTCTYNVLHSDGTQTAAGANLQLRAGEAAILLPTSVSLPTASSIVSGRIVSGGVVK